MVLEGEPELVLGEKVVEHLASHGADCVQLVARTVVIEQDGRERLWRGSGNHSTAVGWIVLAVLRAAMDHLRVTVSGRLLGTIADEADVARRVGELVRADRGIRDHGVVSAGATRPFIFAVI